MEIDIQKHTWLLEWLWLLLLLLLLGSMAGEDGDTCNTGFFSRSTASRSLPLAGWQGSGSRANESR